MLKWTGAILLLCLSLPSTAQYDNVTTDTTVAPPDDLGDDETYPVKKYFIVSDSNLSVQQRNLPPELIKKYQEDEDFWYANGTIDPATGKSKPVVKRKENGKKKQGNNKDGAIQEEEQSRSLSGGTALLLWILIIGVFIAALVMYLGNSNIGLFRKKNRRTNEAAEMEEVITEDIFAINYQRDIDRAASQGNYRLAIRLMFLRSLKNMSEKNIIRYKQDKTNLDYLMELSPTAYYNGFFRVTRNYEYSWYGQFPVSREAYQLIRGEFDQFDKELRSA